MLTGDVYNEPESLSTQIASYFLAAHTVTEESWRSIERDEFKFAVEHWESRLRNQNGNCSWLQHNLLYGIDGPDPDAPCYRNESASEYLKVLDEDGLFISRYILCKRNAAGWKKRPRTLLCEY